MEEIDPNQRQHMFLFSSPGGITSRTSGNVVWLRSPGGGIGRSLPSPTASSYCRLSVFLSVCLSPGVRRKLLMNYCNILVSAKRWAMEQFIKFQFKLFVALM